MCCESQELCAVISIPNTGFLPEQYIPIAVNIENRSNVGVNYIRVILRRIETFTAYSIGHSTMINKRNIAEMLMKGVGAQSTDQIQEVFKVPLLPPELFYCSIIQYSYELKVIFL